MASAKDVVLTASIIGREFSYELLEAVSPVSQATLLEELERLVQSDLLGQRGAPPQSRYIFKHALIRDAAFQSVLNARKRELHERIAEVLASRFPEVVETEPELLAHHYTEANLVDRALAYWRQAAERAAARLAYIEALGHVDKAMKLIAALPEGAERDEWELSFSGDRRALADGAGRLGQSARRNGFMRRRARSLKDWGVRQKCSDRSGVCGWGRTAADSTLAPTNFSGKSSTSSSRRTIRNTWFRPTMPAGSQMVAEGVPRAALAHIDQLLTNYRMDVHGNLALTYGAHDPGCCSLGMRALA